MPRVGLAQANPRSSAVCTGAVAYRAKRSRMLKEGENWQCPYCSHFQVLSDANFHTASEWIASDLNRHDIHRYLITAVECMNPNCREIYLRADFLDYLRFNGNVHHSSNGMRKLSFLLRPNSIAKPQHSSVPSVLITDYEEACLIISASPKAAATLARRCLQGMIRDFCKISKTTLHAEIAELTKQVAAGTAPRQVSEESLEAIDSVRQLGNIGAHFEADINLIVDVEPEEATALISLIELLFQEWYVARFERQERLAKVKAIAQVKKDTRNGDPAEEDAASTDNA